MVFRLRHEILEPKSTVLFRAKKRQIGRRTPPRKHSVKNITRKRKHDEKYIRESPQKKSFFLEFSFAQALTRPKKRNYFA